MLFVKGTGLLFFVLGLLCYKPPAGKEEVVKEVWEIKAPGGDTSQAEDTSLTQEDSTPGDQDTSNGASTSLLPAL